MERINIIKTFEFKIEFFLKKKKGKSIIKKKKTIENIRKLIIK